MKKIVIATRGSELALWQANYVKSEIEKKHGIKCELNIIKTTGDKILDVPLAKIGGKGLFVKEIESALLNNEADIAVHSMKDVPMELPDGLELIASPEAEAPNDAFVSNKFSSIKELPKCAKVGTSSLRRKLQLLEQRPDLEIIDLRGNLQTRLKKLDDGLYDAIILAEAGLKRLMLGERIKESISISTILPASCQGILGIEARRYDNEIKNLLSFLVDKDTTTRVLAERRFLFELQGGCQVPIACHSILDKNKNSIYIKGLIYTLDGRKKLVKEISADIHNPADAGAKLARDILADGGEDILKEIYS